MWLWDTALHWRLKTCKGTPKELPKKPTSTLRWFYFPVLFYTPEVLLFRENTHSFPFFPVGGARIGTFWSWSWSVGANSSTSSSETSPSTRWKRATWQQIRVAHAAEIPNWMMLEFVAFFKWFVLGGSRGTCGNSSIYWIVLRLGDCML